MPNTAYKGQKFRNPVMVKITATPIRMYIKVPLITPVYAKMAIITATTIRMMASLALIFLTMVILILLKPKGPY